MLTSAQLTRTMFSRLSLSRASQFVIPTIAAAAAVGSTYYFSSSAIANDTGKTFTGGDEFIDLKLTRKEKVSADTSHYYFALKNADDVSGLITASCVLAKYVTAKGNNVVRPYTPISDVDEKGEIEFVIKTYPEGKFGNHIANLKEGETVAFKGPLVKFKWEPNSYKEIVLIGGGSGITPLYQLAHEISKNPADKTKVQLYYGNKTKEDILIKKELDAIAAKHPDQFNITYFLDSAPEGWTGKTGFITKDFLKQNVPSPDSDVHFFVCGPPPLYNAISGNKVSPQDQGELTGALAELGYKKEQVFKF